MLDELAQGLTLSGSGFKTHHVYPERVVKEAIVNAVVHRDYRLNRDIFIRIFDDRIEVESPGTFPGGITPRTIAHAGSRARNPLVAQNLREFPVPPNIDAGEGVRMMFAEMARAELYPPQYRESIGTAVESVTVTLLNLKRPTAWDEVSDWIDREGSIANADVVRIAKVDKTPCLSDGSTLQIAAAREDRLFSGAQEINPSFMKKVFLINNLAVCLFSRIGRAAGTVSRSP